MLTTNNESVLFSFIYFKLYWQLSKGKYKYSFTIFRPRAEETRLKKCRVCFFHASLKVFDRRALFPNFAHLFIIHDVLLQYSSTTTNLILHHTVAIPLLYYSVFCWKYCKAGRWLQNKTDVLKTVVHWTMFNSWLYRLNAQYFIHTGPRPKEW